MLKEQQLFLHAAELVRLVGLYHLQLSDVNFLEPKPLLHGPIQGQVESSQEADLLEEK